MNDTKYNGWTNYATWRISLEILDGLQPSDFGTNLDDYDLGQALKDYVDEILCQGCGYEGLVLDYARAFTQDVNWREIAGFLIADYAYEIETETEEEN